MVINISCYYLTILNNKWRQLNSSGAEYLAAYDLRNKNIACIIVHSNKIKKNNYKNHLMLPKPNYYA